MIQIPALNLGFRIFFLGAGLFALAASIIWLLIYLLGWQLLSTGYPPVVWHGHEMLFGYTLAVVVGFLLTAARNWSGIQTIHGLPLGGLFLIWLLARVAPLTGLPGVTMGMVCDVLFCLLSTLCVAHPILLAKLWRNMGIVLLLFLLFIDNLIFYRGLSTGSDEIMNKSLTAGLWLLLTLVLVMGRRIIPMFIQNGVDESFQPKNRLWVDRACLWGFMTFALLDLLGVSPIVVSLAAALLFVLHFWRWLGWHTPGIWKTPLLWVLYVAYAFILLGFLLISLDIYFHFSPFLIMHAFALGGLGLISVGMMARVALGHTGRNVRLPPKALNGAFGLIVVSVCLRVLAPIADPAHYPWWIGLSLTAWILGLSLFLIIYAPMLTRARADGKPG